MSPHLSAEELDTGYSPVIILDADGTIHHANRNALALLDATVDALRGRPLPFAAEAGFASTFEEVLRSEREAMIEAQFLGQFWLCHFVPLVPSGDRPLRVALLCHDITVIHQRAERKVAAQQELTRALVKEVQHRIKNNLQGVVGLLRQHMNESGDSGGALTRAINQLVSIAAVYGIQARLDEDRIYLCSVVNEVARAARSTGPSLRIEGPASERIAALAENHAVPIALIVNELVTNAVKHTPNAPGAQVSLTLRFDATSAQLVVSNGPATLPADFDAMTGNGLGSGLRLAQSLLPSDHAKLQIEQQGDLVIARLTLRPPVVALFNGDRSPTELSATTPHRPD